MPLPDVLLFEFSTLINCLSEAKEAKRFVELRPQCVFLSANTDFFFPTI